LREEGQPQMNGKARRKGQRQRENEDRLTYDAHALFLITSPAGVHHAAPAHLPLPSTTQEARIGLQCFCARKQPIDGRVNASE